jgi:ribosome maturation factor RimP
MPGRDEVRQAVEPVVEELGLELHRLDFAPTRGRAHLRLLIDRPEGLVSLEDCTRVSGAVGRLLDGLDLVPCRYQLEVSSPGVDRPLATPRDFGRFEGSRVRVRLHPPPEDAAEGAEGPRDLTGTLRAYEPETDTLTLVTEGGEIRIARSRIERARLDPELLSPAPPPRRGRP